MTGEASLGQEDRVGIVSIPGRHFPLHIILCLAIDWLSMCVYACIQIHTTWCTSYTNVNAYNMKKKSRHNDSLSICSMKLCSCKLSTDTNEVLLCSASVSVRNVVGCWECLPFYKEKDATYTATLLLRMSYCSNYSCKWRGMLSCEQQLHGWGCLSSIASVCVVCVEWASMCGIVMWTNWWVGDNVAIVGYVSIWQLALARNWG